MSGRYKPTKNPPRTEFWRRIEQARQGLNMSVRKFSIEALGEDAASTYGNIAGRNNWSSNNETADRIVEYLGKHGFTKAWIYRTDSDEPSPEAVLLAEGHPLERVSAALAGARAAALITHPNGLTDDALLRIARALLLLPTGKAHDLTSGPRLNGANDEAGPAVDERSHARMGKGQAAGRKSSPSSLPPTPRKNSR